jgi:hypothetical protein
MKPSKLSTVLSAGAIAASLAILPLTSSVQAQTDTTAPNPYNRTTTEVDTNDDFDWGWLGLLGLAGLAGLLPKKRQEPVRYTTNEPGVGVHSRSDYR